MNITKLAISAMIVCGLHGVAHAQSEPPSTMDGAAAPAAAEHKDEATKPMDKPAAKGKHKKGKKHADH